MLVLAIEGTAEVESIESPFNATLADIRLTIAYFEAQSLVETIRKSGRKSFCIVHSDTVLCDCDPADPGFADFAYAPGFLGAWQAEINHRRTEAREVTL